MTKSSLKAINEKYANTLTALEKGVAYDKTLDGVLSHITKMWNKGYGEAIQSQCGISKPKGFAALMHKLAKGEGVDARMYAHTTDKEGNDVATLGLWATKTLHYENEDVAVLNADGKKTYPTVYTTGKSGKDTPVKVDSIKTIAWTAERCILFVMQNDALKEGAIEPCTADDYWATHEVECIDGVWKSIDCIPEMPAAAPAMTAVAPVAKPLASAC